MNQETVICPYCKQPAELMDSIAVYKVRSYGPAWICTNYPKCDAYVGCHKGSDKPLGRLANRELREAKIKAHAAFDPIWKERFAIKSAQDKKYTKGMARGGRYKKLAQVLGIPKAECHIGMFDIEICNRVVEICKARLLDDLTLTKEEN